MASLQAYQSHGHRYYRIVESFRQDGKPRLRVVAHLGRVEDILRLTQDERADIKVSSVTSGAVTALHHLAQELDIAGKIDHALEASDRRVQKRDGLSVGQSLLAGMISRACAPRSKRAFAAWAEATALPELMGFAAKDLDSQHFWDQMHALPVKVLGDIEQAIVREVIGIEQLQPRALAYDTTNFYTDRKSTRLNSSHLGISYAVFCFRPRRFSPLFPYTTLFRSTSSKRLCARSSASNNYNRAHWPTTPPTSTPISPARTRDPSCHSAGTTSRDATICANWDWPWWWTRTRNCLWRICSTKGRVRTCVPLPPFSSRCANGYAC